MIKKELYNTYMKIAEIYSKLSYCKRLQVGSVVVTATGATYGGYNGTIAGFPNVCEDENNVTLPYVVHAEQNSLYKMLKEGVSAEGSILFSTYSPCSECCKMIVSAGISKVIYKQLFRAPESLDILRQAGVEVEEYKEIE